MRGGRAAECAPHSCNDSTTMHRYRRAIIELADIMYVRGKRILIKNKTYRGLRLNARIARAPFDPKRETVLKLMTHFRKDLMRFAQAAGIEICNYAHAKTYTYLPKKCEE